MEPQQIKDLILRELPTLIQQDSSLREWVLTIGRTQFADQAATESRFDHMVQLIQQQLDEMRRSREEQNCKWEEQNRKWKENQRELPEMRRKSDERWEESQRKWEEQNRKWEENQRELPE